MANRKVLRILVWVFVIGLISAFSAIYYVFNMPRRNIAKENASYTLTAQQLMSEFKKDESAANAKYLDNNATLCSEA